MSGFVIVNPHAERTGVTIENTGEVVIHDAFALDIRPTDADNPAVGVIEIDAAYQGKLTVGIRIGETLLALTVTRDEIGRHVVTVPVGMVDGGPQDGEVKHYEYVLPEVL